GGDSRRDGPCCQRKSEPGAHGTEYLRTGARLGPRHRRQRVGEPHRLYPVGGSDARASRRVRDSPEGRTGRGGDAREGRQSRDGNGRRGDGLHDPAGRGSSGRSAVGAGTLEAGMPLTKTDKIWMDGKLVPWDEATVHILTPTLHYGWGVFEGIRAYPTKRGPALFRLTDHTRR